MDEFDGFGFDLDETPRGLSRFTTEELRAELLRRTTPEETKSGGNRLGVRFPRPDTSPHVVVADAWSEFDETWADGTDCPCCGQWVQVYERRIYGPVAVFLLWLVGASGRGSEWVHVNEAPVLQGRRGGGDKDKLKLFGLAEDQRSEDASKRSSGLWKPTPRGIRFASGEIEVPKYAYVFNKEVRGFSDETVSIQEALGKKYDYREVRGRFWP